MKKPTLFQNKKLMAMIGAISAVVLMLIGYYVVETTTGRVFIDKSLISAPIISVSPSSPGKVQEIDVKEGQQVQTGDTLAVVGSETIRAVTDGLVISAPDLTGSTVGQTTQLIQMIRPVNMRVAGTIDENKGLNAIKVPIPVCFLFLRLLNGRLSNLRFMLHLIQPPFPPSKTACLQKWWCIPKRIENSRNLCYEWII